MQWLELEGFQCTENLQRCIGYIIDECFFDKT